MTHDRVEFRYKIVKKESECAQVTYRPIDLPVIEVTQAGTVLNIASTVRSPD
jgi:hypothetical protein